ncbi:3-deoxy-D-manno-octulosonic acid transferase [Algoriphagus marincola]|uniref:3-deoxy-D-manno-octulosonic acid transferase n=1 Tax=Algoriphagus marincola TaxID=264027 RepID=UPI000423C195|nr:glycosyltransferase N-terminal domain-containing protein [Algoriphagus marincola]
MQWIYNFFLRVVEFLFPVAAIFSTKIADFVKGREGLFERLRTFVLDPERPVIWFHVASLGEYEQAMPVMSGWKRRKPEVQILVSFFSPSGFEPISKKNEPVLDFITYLPLDRPSYARKFLDIVRPDIIYFVKYDLWFNFLKESSSRGIPLHLISASFREDQVYFRRKGFFRAPIFFFDHIFTQNEESDKLLEGINFQSYTRVGDTRFDRVAETARAPKRFPQIETWLGEKPAVVLGSVWQEDMDLLIPLINQNIDFKWIIAPHSMNPGPMQSWESQIKAKCQFYTSWDQKKTTEVLIIDTIGMLASLYQFAQVSYVGGAFGEGLHNILESIGFGAPVIFGRVRKVGKFPEAQESIKQGCGFEVEDFSALKTVFDSLKNPENLERSRISANSWVESNRGATERILVFTDNLQ